MKKRQKMQNPLTTPLRYEEKKLDFSGIGNAEKRVIVFSTAGFFVTAMFLLYVALG